MTRDYVRHGTVTLFAAVNVASGELFGLCTECHTKVEMHQFLEYLQPQFPTDRPVHVIPDNYATHKRENVREWIKAAENRRFLTSTSASWSNAVECYFARLAQEFLRPNQFRSNAELEAGLHEWIAEYNTHPTLFRWNEDGDDIVRSVIRGHRKLALVHPDYIPPARCLTEAEQAIV